MVNQVLFQRLKNLRDARAKALEERKRLAESSYKTSQIKISGSYYSRRVRNSRVKLKKTYIPKNIPGYYSLYKKSKKKGCKSCGKKIK